MGPIAMSERDLQRIEVLSKVIAGRETLVSAAHVLELSTRQVRRLQSQIAACFQPLHNRRRNSMSASLIYDLASIGSIVSWSDGGPPPPKRLRRKFSAWESRNGVGRLIGKDGPRVHGKCVSPPSITLFEAGRGANDLAVCVYRTFSLESDLVFKVIARPAVGSVRILQWPSGSRLLHLAENHEAAEAWLRQRGFPDAVIEEVGDEGVTGHVEGRPFA